MRISSYLVLFVLALAGVRAAAPEFRAEAGASLFLFKAGQLEPGAHPLWVDEPERVAPFVAVSHELSRQFGLRLSYHFLNHVTTTTQLGSPPGSPLAVVVWGHYEDDIHVVTAEPEFNLSLAPRLTLSVAPQVNWVVSQGVIRYSTDNPLVLLLAPRHRREDGFTLGGAARLRWEVGPRAALSLGYEYKDLDPSFDYRAHVITGGVQWKF